MKNILYLLFIFAFILDPAHTLSVFPDPNTRPVTNDPLINFQWALNSDGQQIIQSLGTHIDSEYINSVPDADLKIINIIEELEANIKQNLIVAVLDFGLDYNHPDIINNGAYNPEECDTDSSGTVYKIPFRPQEDKDGNGHKGDCLGWNFTDDKNKQGNNTPMDHWGHGTHIAGIIAAEKNNHLGISGVSNKIKVLPIKVMHERQNKKRDADGRSFTEKVAQGIRYAIVRKADVINLSLGWPSFLDHRHIRQAVQQAVDQGIIVVAAAGNNKNNRPIAPCNYPGVLCVGSLQADKTISSFSNFGGHVDIVAPGSQILSLFPQSMHNVNQANLFNVPGYEIKSGTSQAAPYVSAIAALLKGALQIDADEVKARIFSTAENLTDKIKYFRDGLVNLEEAYKARPRTVLRPEFKNLELLKINSQNNQFSFPLTIKNYWNKSAGLKLQVNSLTPHVKIKTGNFHLTALEKGEAHIITIIGEATDSSASCLARLSISLIHQGVEEKYPFELILANDLASQSGTTDVPIEFDDEIKAALNKAIELNIPGLPIRTITDMRRYSAVPQYYFVSREQGGIRLKILKRIDQSYKITKIFFLPRAKVLMSFHQDDFEGDGQPEYVIRTGYETAASTAGSSGVGGNGKKATIVQYTFLDRHFNPYYGDQHSTWELNVNENNFILFEQRLDKMQFLAFSRPQQSAWIRPKIWVPVFIKESLLPKADQNPSFFAFAKNLDIPRINFLVPEVRETGAVVINQRVLSNYQVQQQLDQQLNKSWKQRLYFYSLLAPHRQLSGRPIRVLMGLQKKTTTDYYIFNLLGKALPRSQDLDFIKYEIIPLQDKINHQENFSLELNEVYSSIKIDHSNDSYHFDHSDIFFAPFSEQMARVALLDPYLLSITKKSVIKQKNFREKIRRFVQSFEMGHTLYTFLETNNFLTLLKTDGYHQTEIKTAPLIRFSFVPGYILRESVIPFVVKKNHTWKPALYVDSSHITSRYVYAWILDQDQLSSPLKLSIAFPPHCRSRDISIGAVGQGPAYIFLCSDDHDNWFFKFLPISL